VATVLLPGSLLALFPGATKRHVVEGETVAAVIHALDRSVPGVQDRLVESGPRLRPHVNVFVDGAPADLATAVGSEAVIHILPAVSGGSEPSGTRWPNFDVV
jgi:molybdopterin converting factor small subunit